ncbi:MAG: aminotransferase class IV, partial [Panacagrimonas sp.]
FIVCNGQLFTPDLSRCGVAGMMREKIMLIAQHLNIPLTVSQISAAALDQADEILLCNALNGIWPVRQVGERQIDAPGPFTQRLAEQLQHPAWYR